MTFSCIQLSPMATLGKYVTLVPMEAMMYPIAAMVTTTNLTPTISITRCILSFLSPSSSPLLPG